MRDLGLAGPDRRLLGVAQGDALRKLFFLRRLRRLTKEVAPVVEHLELEAGGLADDVADLFERPLVLARDLDDDVLVAHGDGRFAETKLVDATVDGVLGLVHRALAEAGLDLGPDLEVRDPFFGSLNGHLTLEPLQEFLVDLGVVARILELDVDDRDLVARLLEHDLLLKRRQLVTRRRLVTGVKTELGRQHLAHLVVVAIALVLDRLFDVDRVDEPEPATKVETGDDLERDVVANVLGAMDLALRDALERRPDAEKRPQPERHHEPRLEPPREVQVRQRADEGPDCAEREGREHPEGLVVGREPGRDGANGGGPERPPPVARKVAEHEEEKARSSQRVLENPVYHLLFVGHCGLVLRLGRLLDVETSDRRTKHLHFDTRRDLDPRVSSLDRVDQLPHETRLGDDPIALLQLGLHLLLLFALRAVAEEHEEDEGNQEHQHQHRAARATGRCGR